MQLHRPTPDEWRTWREISLRALADSPDAFRTTLAQARDFTEEDWRHRLASMPVLVIAEGRPVAMGAGHRARDGWMEVIAMWTDPGWRGRGLARRVLDAVVADARAEGRRVALSVTRDNGPARAAYEHYGFVATGECEPLRDGSSLACDEMVLPE